MGRYNREDGLNLMRDVSARHKLLYLIMMAIVSLALLKYVIYPEPYAFDTGCSDGLVKINGNVITQEIVLNDDSVWSGDAYFGLYLHADRQPSAGFINVSLMQDGIELSSVKIGASEVREGAYDFNQIDYSGLDAEKEGRALVEVSGGELDQVVYLRSADNIYNLPSCEINGSDENIVLAQRYHFHFMSGEYAARLVLFGIFIIINCIAGIILFTHEESRRTCRMLQVAVIASYMAASFIYTCKLYMYPLYNDLPVNYMHNAITYGTLKNLVATDAGYIPLCQRLITLLVFKVLNIKAYYAVYILQLLAYLFSGCLFSFFLGERFKDSMPVTWRYLLCMLCSLYFSGGQQVFYNFIYLGIIILLAMFLTDMSKWSRNEFAALTLLSAAICMSKGTYVTILPFIAVYIMLFYQHIGRREKLYLCSCAAACLIQLSYYFLYGSKTPYGMAGNWMSRSIAWADMDGNAIIHTLIKLALSIFIDIPNKCLLFLGSAITRLNGARFLIVAIFWIAVIYLFFRCILKKWIRKEPVDLDYARFFAILAFIGIFSLLLRVSIYGVSDINRENLFVLQYRGPDKYEISIYIAVIFLYFYAAKILARKLGAGVKGYAAIAFALCLMLSSAHLQVKGIGNERFCAGRIYDETDICQGEPVLLKDIEDVECRTVPIMSSTRLYAKNARAYCFGENVFNWFLDYGNVEAEGVDVIDAGKDFSSGKLKLTDEPDINQECQIWQVYVSRTSLINNEKYEIHIIDDRGDEVASKAQDNPPCQLVASFTFDEPLDHVGSIEVRDARGNDVKIKNGIYLVCKRQDSLVSR